MFGRHTTLALCALGLLAQPFVQGQQTGQIIPTTLPACAQTCPILQQALQSCQANPQAAASCFCQSGLLQPIRTAGTNICNTVCQAADWTTISNWFKQYCANPANPGQGQAGGQTTTTATKPTKTTATTTAPTDQAAATSSDASYLGSDDINRPESGSQWWSNHWEWVLMVIILVIAFTAIGVGGSIWYKRRKRRREGWDDPRPAMSTWAPSRHSVHDFGDAQQGAHQTPAGAPPVPPLPGRGKGKGRATAEATTAPLPPQSPPLGKGRKLRKVLGRG
ncbi:MAG: hypothetical protein MMC23_002236 [Stictis urceolatum]|nr:hypothetical protein [Stictis urceolata]